METVELSAQDRARIDSLIKLIKDEIMDDDVIVSCTEAARLLGRNQTTISMMIRTHRLNKVTVGGSTGIRLSEIKDYKNRREAREP